MTSTHTPTDTVPEGVARIALALADAGATDVEVTEREGDYEVTADCFGETITIDGDGTVTDHPLLTTPVRIEDVEALVESAWRARQDAEDAWMFLCDAEDFADSTWEQTVEELRPYAYVTERGPLTHVTLDRGRAAALVDERDDHWLVTDVDPASLERTMCYTHAEVAAAVIYAIS